LLALLIATQRNHYRQSRSSGQDVVEQDSHTSRLGQCRKYTTSTQHRSQREAKLADFKQHMEREGLPFMESETPPVTGYTEVNFLARLRDRIVNQGMQVIVEAEVQGGRAKGIEHLEDLVFRNGSAGIKRATDIVKHTASDTGKTTTVKWDGKPALIFGRDQTEHLS
jgi:hypothetical protein